MWFEMATLLHTSVSSVAVKSRSSLCRNVGKPPFEHVIAWLVEKGKPQLHLKLD